MGIKTLLLYFVLGGVIVSVVTYFGSQAKSLLAAFIAFLPSISVITLCSIYYSSGTEGAVSYKEEHANTVARLAAVRHWCHLSSAAYRSGRLAHSEHCRLFSRLVSGLKTSIVPALGPVR